MLRSRTGPAELAQHDWNSKGSVVVQPISRTKAAVAAAAVVAVAVIGTIIVVTGSDDDDSSAPDPTTTTFPQSSGAPTAASGTPTPEKSKTAKATKPAPSPSTTAGGSRPKPQVVPLDDTADLAAGTTARVVKVTRVTGEAEIPGEVGGPAISVEISVVAGQDLDLATAVVNGYYGSDDTPATPLTSGTQPLVGTLAKGKEATGTYVFRLPKAGLGRVTVELDLSLGQPITLFRGAVGS